MAASLRRSELRYVRYGFTVEGIRMGFDSPLGRVYGVMSSGAMTAEEWRAESVTATGSGGYAEVVVTNFPGQFQFYGLNLLQPAP